MSEVAGESASIAAADAPRTRSSLLADLQQLGMRPGVTLMVHASLSSLGWVAGGPVAVIQALLDAVGEGGTLVMPSFTGDLTEPSYWQHPPVPEHWQQIIRDKTPGLCWRIQNQAARSCAKRETRVPPGRSPSHQATKRTTLTANAVNTCWMCVFSIPV